MAILGVAVLAASRLLGSEATIREVVTEVIAGFGNAIFLLAVFELFFMPASSVSSARRPVPTPTRRARNGRERRRCRASGQASRAEESSAGSAKLDSIEEDLRSLVDRDLYGLKKRIGIEEVRELVSDARLGSED